MSGRLGSWIAAPAKINLRLEVLGRRPDGYHELRTWMLALELWDRLRARERDEPGVDVELSGPAATDDIPRDGRNLAARAAAAGLERARAAGAPVPAGLTLELEKHVPAQSGLGGASADAAAALVAVEDLLQLDLGTDCRRTLLAELGSDCVFFEAARESGFALCTGRGDRVQVLAPPPLDWWVVLLTPDLGCPTESVYRALEWPLSEPAPGSSSFPERGRWDVENVVPWLHNDLRVAALRAVPGLAIWLETLAPEAGSMARTVSPFVLSGSGSSLFSLHSSESRARLAASAARTLLDRRGLALRGSWILKPARRALVRISDERDV